jgi:hypothetical protein
MANVIQVYMALAQGESCSSSSTGVSLTRWHKTAATMLQYLIDNWKSIGIAALLANDWAKD